MTIKEPINPEIINEYRALGVDFEQTCQRMGMGFYFKLLVKFKNTQSAKLDILKKRIEEENFEEIKNSLHAFRGVCSSLGINRMAEDAAMHEKNWVKKDNNMMKQFESLVDLFNKINTVTEKYKHLASE